MRAEAAALIRDTVAPAYVKLLAFIRDEYLAKARPTLAAVKMPDGEAYYQAMIEKFTTLKLTPKEIHEIGLKEVARIEAEMAATKERSGFKGTMAEFFQFLRTDPQFYAKTPRETALVLGLHREEGRHEARGHDRVPAPAPPRDPARARSARADLHGRPRRARRLSHEHLRPALPPALHHRAPDPARVHPRPQLPGRARSRRTRASGRSAAARRSPPTAKAGASTPSGSARRWASTRRPTRTSAGTRTRSGAPRAS
jgi:hypothetical protein